MKSVSIKIIAYRQFQKTKDRLEIEKYNKAHKLKAFQNTFKTYLSTLKLHPSS